MFRLAIAALSLLLTGLDGQAPPSFAGRWRLADVAPSKNAATELLVTVTPSGRISVERRFGTGDQYANFTLVTTQAARRRTDALLRHGSLVLSAPTAVQVSIAAGGAHEEVWSLTPDAALIVETIDQSVGRAPSRGRMTYVRVPRPTSVSPKQNLLENSAADRDRAYWFVAGDAKVDACGGNKCFMVRNGGSFHQTVILPEDAARKYLVIVGAGSTERVNPDGAITGLPTLYGLVSTEDGMRIVAHLQGMLGRATLTDNWIVMSGVFRLPEGAYRLSLQLNQASARGVPHNGSASRYDDLGVYIFASELEARTFSTSWLGRSR